MYRLCASFQISSRKCRICRFDTCGGCAFALPLHLPIGNLFDVVHHALQVPLGVDFALAAKREAIQLFVVPDIGKHGLDRAHSCALSASTLFAVDGALHQFGGLMWAGLVFVEDGHLPHYRRLWCAQALRAKLTGLAVAFASGNLVMHSSIDDAACSVAVHRLARRADAGVLLRIVREVFRTEQRGFRSSPCLVV